LWFYNYNEIILGIFRGLSEVGSKIIASNHLKIITEENTELLSSFKTVLQKLTTDNIIELPQAQKNMQDYRNTAWKNLPTTTYHQVFENKLGFVGNLSIFDLLFNCGNESQSILKY
jgi:hypothetical protein